MKNYLEWGKVFLYIGIVCSLGLFNIVGMGKISQYPGKRREEAGRIAYPAASVVDGLVDAIGEMQISQEEKIAYLTFDDGPSDNTDRILDILKEKGVKATFFVVGKTGERAEARYRRIVEEGHTLGMHSFSHRYEEIYASLDNFKQDVSKLRQYLHEVTGEEMWLYRFPGGSSNSVAKVSIQECIQFLEEEGIVYFDWNASSEDAVEVNASCYVLNSNVLKDALRFQRPVILMHDLYECNSTVDGLPDLIDRLLQEEYRIEAITQQTKPVHHRN